MHLFGLRRCLQPILIAVFLSAFVAPIASADGPDQSLPPPPPLRDVRFGAVEAYTAPEAATAAGVGWTRILFWWHQVQPGGPHDWNAFYFPDGVLNQELNANRELAGIVAGTPAWASDTGSPHAVPAGLYLSYDDPNNLWGQFIYRLAQRYKGQINHWIIWNEPDIWEPNHPGFTWDGSVQDYVQLLKIARRAAKAANPDAVIHLAATTYWWDYEYGREQYFKRLLDAIVADPEAAAEDSFFDVASLHIYFKPQQVWDVTRYFRMELDRHGLGNKRLWINETNAPPSSDPLHPAPGLRFPISLEQQANFVIQAWALGLAAGAERVSLYKTRDESSLAEGVEPYGMIRKDGSVRPVFWTYRALVTYLGHYTSAHLLQDGPVRRVVVERGELGQTTIVWNTGPTARRAIVPTEANQALLVDELGPVEILTAHGGGYALTLPPAVGEIAGTTYLLVEGPGMDLQIPRPAGDGLASPVATGPPPTLTVEVTISPEPTTTAAPDSNPPPTATLPTTAGGGPSPTATATPSPAPSATPSPSLTASSTASATPSPSVTTTPTASPEPAVRRSSIFPARTGLSRNTTLLLVILGSTLAAAILSVLLWRRFRPT
ncbi:MAG TPA: hypothetical protein DEP84_27830 [Chloroflexi bacterium]|nr:hypothetical protein [Chloroflexota bacterium]